MNYAVDLRLRRTLTWEWRRQTSNAYQVERERKSGMAAWSAGEQRQSMHFQVVITSSNSERAFEIACRCSLTGAQIMLLRSRHERTWLGGDGESESLFRNSKTLPGRCHANGVFINRAMLSISDRWMQLSKIFMFNSSCLHLTWLSGKKTFEKSCSFITCVDVWIEKCTGLNAYVKMQQVSKPPHKTETFTAIYVEDRKFLLKLNLRTDLSNICFINIELHYCWKPVLCNVSDILWWSLLKAVKWQKLASCL